MPLPSLKKYLFCSLLALGALSSCLAQEAAIKISHSLKPTTDFDQRFYYPGGAAQNVWGYRVGVLINDKFKLGIGGYYMDEKKEADDVSSTSVTRTSTGTINNRQQLYLGTVYYEPYLIRKNLWEMSVVFETGYGRNTNYLLDDKNTALTGKVNTLVIPAGAGLSLNLKVPALFHVKAFRWIGINAIAGYRRMLYQEDKSLQYNGAYWSLSGAIFLDRVLDDYHAYRKHRRALKSKPTELHF